MPEYDDMDRRDDGFDDRGRDGDRGRRGREKAATPGAVLLGFGVVSLILAVVSLALYGASPDTVARPYHSMMVDLTKGQPGAVPPYEEFKQQMIVQGMIGSVVAAVCSLLIILGGLRMKSLSGYGLALTGAILALVPCTNSCCCIGLPVGIWALTALLNADVKAAFEANSRRADGGGEFDR